jgi:RNA polymerase sigma-70 factor (ECF subfamily)
MLLAGRGDRVACGALYERHRGRVRALARRMRCASDETDDVAQEVFLRVWRAAPAWRPRARFETWLRRVTVNVCRDRLAKRREVPCDGVSDVVDAAQDPSRDAYVAEVGSRLRHALALLPESQRVAIVRRYHHGVPRRELATAMGVGTEALESLLARARRALRLRLRPLGRDACSDAGGIRAVPRRRTVPDRASAAAVARTGSER